MHMTSVACWKWQPASKLQTLASIQYAI